MLRPGLTPSARVEINTQGFTFSGLSENQITKYISQRGIILAYGNGGNLLTEYSFK